MRKELRSGIRPFFSLKYKFNAVNINVLLLTRIPNIISDHKCECLVFLQFLFCNLHTYVKVVKYKESFQ